ncbi:MAG: methionine biosynthesis protein MetW [Alphaproteobacteria bacterium]|nr:methionine biosynthesis protein MetW [Alphaproteobacteria bacterium]MCB9929564.1 methionine biosynthesis protein MetW [Alphaproteobacteria bacterium]
MIDPTSAIRPDLQIVADWIAPGTRVLDIGCGFGALLDYLVREKNVDGRGIEIRRAKVNHCVAAGLSVIRGDANRDLSLYPTDSFDYVVLTQTLQTVEQPRAVLEELMRIGNRVIVSIPNFGHWRIRLSLLLNGRMPITEALNQPWYETRNIHFCTIRDFLDLVEIVGLNIERAVVLNAKGKPSPDPVTSRRANIFGEQAVFMLQRR